MDDKLIMSSAKAIIVEDNVITNIVDSIEEYESSDALFIDVGGRSVVPGFIDAHNHFCLLYTSPSPRDRQKSRMPSSA